MFAPIARRAVLRSAPRVVARRTFASEAPTATHKSATEAYHARNAAMEAHAAQTSDLWRKVSYYVCIPGIIVCGVWTYQVESEHKAHIEHEKHEHGGELPEVPAYDYLNKRTKPFPWGMNSLFWNAEANKDMTES